MKTLARGQVQFIEAEKGESAEALSLSPATLSMHDKLPSGSLLSHWWQQYTVLMRVKKGGYNITDYTTVTLPFSVKDYNGVVTNKISLTCIKKTIAGDVYYEISFSRYDNDAPNLGYFDIIVSIDTTGSDVPESIRGYTGTEVERYWFELVRLSDYEYLLNSLPDENLSTDISNGIILSNIIGVKDNSTPAKVVAALNGLSTIPGFNNTTHGTIMLASGITNLGNSNTELTASTKIYSDGTIDTTRLVARSADISGKVTASTLDITSATINGSIPQANVYGLTSDLTSIRRDLGSCMNDIADHFGYADYDTMIAAAKAGGATFIQGGYINTNLINADAVVTNYLSANKITADQIDTTNLTISAGNVSGLGTLATKNTVSASTDVTGLGSLATKNNVGTSDLDSTIISGGYIKTSLINASAIVIGSNQVSGLGSLATKDSVSASTDVTGLGSLATKNAVSASTDITGLASVATSGSYNSLSDKPTIPDVSNLADRDVFAQKLGYTNYAALETAAANNQTIITGGLIRTSLIDADAIVTNYLSSNYITANQIDGDRLVVTNGIFSGEVTAYRLNLARDVLISQNNISGLTSDLASKADSSDLSDVAFSGDYDDLTNTPTIPSLQGYIYQDGVVGTTPAAGATGFVVSSAGLLTASNAIIYGTIYASTGQIGNWALSQGKLSSGSGNTYTAIDTNPNNSYVIWAGAENPGNAVFSVGRSGAIKATSGLIGPFSIMPANLIAIDDGMVLRRLLILEPGYVSQTVARTASSTSFLGVTYGLDEASVSVNSQAAMYIKNNRPSDVAGANKDNIGVDIGVTAANMNNTGLSIKTSYGVTNTCIDATLTSSSTYDTTSSACAKFLIQGDGYEKTGILVTAKGSGTKYGVDVSITSGNGAKTAYRATVAGTATTDTCYGFYADVSGSGAKYAFYANNGVFGGLRPNTKVITSSSVTLSASDFTIINTYSSGDTTLSIPSDCEKVGQTYLVLNTVQKRITIKPRSGATIKCNGYTYTYSSPMVTGSEELMILLVCTGPGAWYATYHYEDD